MNKVKEIQFSINQLKQENDTRMDFINYNYHKIDVDSQVKCTCETIYLTQSRFELLLLIIEAQQEQINNLLKDK